MSAYPALIGSYPQKWHLWVHALALLWQILVIDWRTGFPNRIFNDSWVVGFWRADHGEHEVQKLEIGLGMKEGEKKVDEAVANAGKAINGWRVSSLFGDSAFFNGDWLKRAAGAKGGIYGNDAAEAMYPLPGAPTATVRPSTAANTITR
jgi:hypothetical protein